MNSEELTIEAYTRADALADGILMDVTDQARIVGFKVPVAMSRAAWSMAVEWTAADTQRQIPQEQSSRLWDVLTLCFAAARSTDTHKLTFRLYRIPRSGEPKPALLILKALIDLDDTGKPAVTISLPDEV